MLCHLVFSGTLKAWVITVGQPASGAARCIVRVPAWLLGGILAAIVGFLFFSCVPAAYAETVSADDNPTATAASDVGSIELTDEEETYLATHPSVSIAMDTSWVPYAFFDSDSGEVKGVLVNLLDMVCEPLGIEVDYVAKNSYSEALQTVQSGETDLVSGIADDQAMADKNHLQRTKPYVNINYCAVSKGAVPDLFVKGAQHKVAVCAGSYSLMAMRESMPNYEFVEYYSDKECMAAVEKGDVDVALIASYAADYYLSDASYDNLSSTLISDFSWGLCFGANEDVDPVLLGILNKGITAMASNDVNQAVYLGMMEAVPDNSSLRAWFERNQLLLFCGSAVLATTVFLTIVFYQRRRSRVLQKQRDTDGLTGLLNRFAFECEVGEYLKESQRAAAFVILDLDEFKRINDAYGHAAGDEVLCAVAASIVKNFRADDFLARLGGDEFVIFVPACGELNLVSERVESLLRQVSEVSVPGHEEFHVSASAGIAGYPAGGETFVELYRHADAALYRAKRSGKGGFARYESE